MTIYNLRVVQCLKYCCVVPVSFEGWLFLALTLHAMPVTPFVLDFATAHNKT